MALTENTRETFNAVASVLMWCFIFSMVILLWWFFAITIFDDMIYEIHEDMFGLPREKLEVIHYTLMAILKLSAFMFFFFPWVGIKLVLKKDRAKAE